MNGLRKRKSFQLFTFIQVENFYVYVSRSYIVSNFIYARKGS